MARKPKNIAEFGDFQTPDELARRVLSVVEQIGVNPGTIIEPTCGVGSFLSAAASSFPNAALLGVEINESYVAKARDRFAAHERIKLIQESFFSYDWLTQIRSVSGPLLVIGNPPWVTNAELGMLGSGNLPSKSNFKNLKGMDALTGKSNFDISEWMILQNLDWLAEKSGSLAVLCKTAVARKVLSFAWKRKMPIAGTRIYQIDAKRYFNAAVDACLFFLQVDCASTTTECPVFSDLEQREPSHAWGFMDHTLVRDLGSYRSVRELRAHSAGRYIWRSGLKHDCARIMELELRDGQFSNGLGEVVDLEDTYLFPLMKSSDVAKTAPQSRKKYVIVPQRSVGQETLSIKRHAPRTWEYLDRHRAPMNARTSSIYRGKPEFSVFGIGAYSFAPWKIAISGLYKKLAFKLYGPSGGKPVFFDDTVYLLSFADETEAKAVYDLLNTKQAQQFFGSMVFWDEKRPITTELLRKLDIDELARAIGQPLKHGPTSSSFPGELPLAG